MKLQEPPTPQSNNSSGLQLISDAEIELLQGRFSALENSIDNLYGFLPFGMHTLDANHFFSKINRFEQESLGYDYSELLGKKKISDLLDLESRAPYALFLKNPSRYEYPNGVSLRFISKFGVVLPFRLSQASAASDNSGSFRYVLYNDAGVGMADDRLRIAAIAFESQQGIMVTDVDKRILRVNSAFTTITGYSEAEVIGKTPAILSSGKHQQNIFSDMWRTINAQGKWQGPIENKRKNGQFCTLLLSIAEVRDKQGSLINYVGTMADISEEMASKQTIERLAFYDPLTSLPNRQLLMSRLTQLLATTSRHRSKGAVLFFDLDDFKLVNDSRGHDYGDRLLQEVAKRLLSCLRIGDTAARMGGDEFIVLLENLGEDSAQAAKKANAVCSKIRSLLLTPVDIDGVACSTTASIGVAMIEDGSLSAAELLKQADIAMYQAKHNGRDAQCFFGADMQIAIIEHIALEADLRSALKNNEFELYYQLQVDETGKAIGAESLIRWNHPRKGLLYPGAFIVHAQESELICELGRWVLNTACKQLQHWASDAVFKDLPVSINVSAREFRQEKFVQQVKSSIDEYKVRFAALKIELTEGMLVESVEHATQSMEALSALGVLIELDDFGTGFSSLKYIKVFPISRLKIDQSFVSDLTKDGENTIVIIRAIIAMAGALGIEVIAEGVENETQRALLLRENCTQFQGYLFARPMPLTNFEECVRKHTASH